MTVKQIFEEIRMWAPDAPEQQMYSLINETQKSFTRKTRLLVAEVSVALVAGTHSYEIPSTVHAVKKVFLANASSETVLISGASYKIEDWHIKFYTDELEPLSSFDTATQILVKCTYKPSDLTAYSDTPIFEGEFHRVLVWGAVEALAALKGNFDLMKLAKMKVMEYVLEGKQYANTAASDIRQDYIPPLYADDIDTTEQPTSHVS